MDDDDIARRLTTWLVGQIPDAENVHISGLDRATLGHSAETLLLAVDWCSAGVDRHEDAVVRLRPPSPGLLEPYDLKRQFEILRALESTPVRSPRALWHEPTGAVLGREFYVMERLSGEVFEMTLPEELIADPGRARRMCESMIDQIAAMHAVDIHATGLVSLLAGGDSRDGNPGGDALRREVDHWVSEIRRCRPQPGAALERLIAELEARWPGQHPTVTMVHGDAKPGNFAFLGDEVSAVYDWEMAGLGDPRGDIGYAEILWTMPGSINTVPDSITAEEMIARYEARSGITLEHRDWFRAFGAFRMLAIMCVGAWLFEQGHSSDRRLRNMSFAIDFIAPMALAQLGIDANDL